MIFDFLKRSLKFILAKLGIWKGINLVEPGGKIKLDAEYKAGRWDYLANDDELSRFSVIVGYCQHLNKNVKILEIGCGEGLLKARLCSSTYSFFTGIDISEEAIKKALIKKDEKSDFVEVDAMRYSPKEKFDIIIFNECLIYFENPAALVSKYINHLNENGFIMVSIFYESIRSKKIWKVIEPLLEFQTGSRINNYHNFVWDIKVFKSKQVSK
jgi:2-polyprenyl-3-methyl-5-hydroxy-6-metoxy-1,4-benzoquinol methylase